MSFGMPGPSVLLLRHAQSTWNASARWQGQADPPLSEAGEEQIETAVHALLGEGEAVACFDLIVSSDLKRARATAAGMATGLGVSAPHLLERGLREYDVGEWSGLTRAEIESRWPGELGQFDAGQLEAPPGGETRAGFDRRIGRIADRLSAAIRTRGVQRVLMVTHGGVIRSMARGAGMTEIPITHLSGYEAFATTGGLARLQPVSLLPVAPHRGGEPARTGSEAESLGAEQEAL
ncbi:MAG: histidine phosphatase family protein [Acidimicrobiales bacterium]|nr:histidine phosphatase family protein [Acidimicrobiales bacterium]